MANYKGHIAGGALAGTAVLAGSYAVKLGSIPDGGNLLSDYQLILGVLVLAILFALWPDVDTNSKAQDLFFGVAFLFDIFLIINKLYVPAAVLGLLAMMPIIGSHRGWTHSKLAGLLVPLPILIIPYLVTKTVGDVAILLFFAAVAGYYSHFLLDGLIIKKFRIKGSWHE